MTHRDDHVISRRRKRPASASQCMVALCVAHAAAHAGGTRMEASAFQVRHHTRSRTTIMRQQLSSSTSHILRVAAEESDHDDADIISSNIFPDNTGNSGSMTSRREVLMKIITIPSAVAIASASVLADPVNAAQSEIDSKSGELFSPKAKMLGGGGSDAARGIQIRDRTTDTAQQKRSFAKSVGQIQPVYPTRFIAYLSRFLLNFDPAAKSWWLEEAGQLSAKNIGKDASTMAEQLRFAEFAESVEVGLADYFLGPYGSYASLEAAKAGVSASAPATSGGIVNSNDSKFDFAKLLVGFGLEKKRKLSTLEKKRLAMSEVKQKQQGIKNLLTLLQARYKSLDAKRQLAILFSLVEDAALQPIAEIKALLGEADNASVKNIEIVGLQTEDEDFRLSSRRGGGYSVDSRLDVSIELPPALGQEYRPARIEPIMRPTTRVLKINVLDGGAGYKKPPTVTVTSQNGVKRNCEAVAILSRNGTVDSILVLDPGYGYGGDIKKRGPTEPVVQISPPKGLISPTKGLRISNDKTVSKDRNGDTTFRQATAEAELEYAIQDIRIDAFGTGYVASQPPKITIRPCEQDPEWYVSPMTYRAKRGGVAAKENFLEARVTSMILGCCNTTVTIDTSTAVETAIDARYAEPYFDAVEESIIANVAGDSLSLLPSTIRPQFSPVFDRYIIPDLPPIPEDKNGIALPSLKYRAIDPIFGGVGSKPVIIGAKDLTVSEYTRLALSGAVCTVLVRTLLNPLELVKTKIQLGNDKELLDFATAELSSTPSEQNNALVVSNDTDSSLFAKGEPRIEGREDAKIGTFELITSLIKLRGPLSLFQSADVTFLASLVFGSFGFGATELFRRFFTNAIFEESPGGGTGEELVLLAAAGIACVLTSLAATPFEMIRVQSMGKVGAQSWTEVLADFLSEKRRVRKPLSTFRGGTGALPPTGALDRNEHEKFRLRDIKKEDLRPLFSGFTPIVSRELPFAVTKFLVFDLLARTAIYLINSQGGFLDPVQVGVGPIGLAISAFAGAIAGIAGAIISHPADLILTLTSSATKKDDGASNSDDEDSSNASDWRPLVKELLEKDGGVANLFAGLPARALFFFLVIGLQFFLYDFVKGLFNVSSDDLTLVLDVFYAVRQGLVDT